MSSPNFVTRKLADVMEDEVNVEYFGAIPDDGQDDLAAFRHYRNWCRTFQKTFYYTEGAFHQSDSLHHPGSNLDMKGRGQGSRVYLTGNGMRAAVFFNGISNAGLHDVMFHGAFTAATNVSVVEFVGSCFYNTLSGLRITNNTAGMGGTSRAIYLNPAGGTEVLWLTVLNCKAEFWKYGLDAGDGGAGNLSVLGGHWTQNDENIRLGAGGGSHIWTAVGGARGNIGLHALSGCNDATFDLFSEVQSSTHVAAVKFEVGANRNNLRLINGGDAPAVIDLGQNNAIQISGTSQSVAGVAGADNYHKLPYLDLTGRSSQNTFNGGLYLTNAHDSTANTGGRNQAIVFQGRVTAGGSIQPTAMIDSYRRFGGGNYGGLGFWINETGPVLATDVNIFGLKQKRGDVEVETLNSGFVLKSPNGTRHRISVSNAGVLSATAL